MLFILGVILFFVFVGLMVGCDFSCLAIGKFHTLSPLARPSAIWYHFLAVGELALCSSGLRIAHYATFAAEMRVSYG